MRSPPLPRAWHERRRCDALEGLTIMGDKEQVLVADGIEARHHWIRHDTPPRTRSPMPRRCYTVIVHATNRGRQGSARVVGARRPSIDRL
jgi:hypothetical protein